MSLSNKYNIPQDTIKKMMNDGVISCLWPRYEEIYDMFKAKMALPGAVKSRVIFEIEAKTGISERHIRRIISSLK